MPSLKITPPQQPQPSTAPEPGSVPTAAALGQPLSRGGDEWWQPRNPLQTQQQTVDLAPGTSRGGASQAFVANAGLKPMSTESGGLVQPQPQSVTLGHDPSLSVRVHPKWGEKFVAATVGVGPMSPEGSPTQRIAAVPGKLTPQTSVSVQAVEVLYPNETTVQKLKVGLQSEHLAAGVTVVDNAGSAKDVVEYWLRTGVPEANLSARYVDRPEPQRDSVGVAVNIPLTGERGAGGEVALGVQRDPTDVKVRLDVNWRW